MRLNLSENKLDEIASDLKRDGYVLIRNALSKEEMAPLIAQWHRLRDPLRAGDTINGIKRDNFYVHGKLPLPLGNVVHHPIIKNIAKKLLGPDVALYFSRLNVKDQALTQSIHLHQDLPYFNGGENKFNFFIALQDTNINNGAMVFVPGSHRFGLLDRSTIDISKHPELEVIIPSLQPGDLIITDILLWHSSVPNTQGTDRALLQMVFQPANDGSYYPLSVPEPCLIAGQWRTNKFTPWQPAANDADHPTSTSSETQIASPKLLNLIKRILRRIPYLRQLVNIARPRLAKIKSWRQEISADKTIKSDLTTATKRILKNATANKIGLGAWSVFQSLSGETKLRYRGCAVPILLLCKYGDETALFDKWIVSDSSTSHVFLRAKDARLNCDIGLKLQENGVLFLSCKFMAYTEFFVQELSLILLHHKNINLFDYIGRRREPGTKSLWLGRGLVRLGKEIDVDLPNGSGFHYFNEGLMKAVLEHEDAHPHVTFPFRQDSSATASYNSAIKVNTGAQLHYEIRFCPVETNVPVALPWLHRNGHLATFVCTEHACHTATPVHKAVYFGRSDINSPEQSVGGICKHGIPITKSIHATNRNKIDNTGQSAAFPGPMASLDDPDFASFIESLQKSQQKIEICLHCADPESSTPEQTDEALKKLGETATWIDHIWLRPTGNVTGCKEAYVCEGTDQSSNAYMVPVWAKHGIRYFWNPVYEYKAPWAGKISPQIKGERFFRVNEEIDNSGLLAPLFWKSKMKGRTVWNWATFTGEQAGGNPRDWGSAFSAQALQDFCAWRGVYFSHAYLTYAGEKAWLAFQDKNIVKLDPSIDDLFARLAKLRQAGEIYCTTISDFLEYAEALEQVVVTPISEKAHQVTYTGDKKIMGFTLAVHSPRPIKVIEPKMAFVRNLDQMNLIVFDLPPHSSVQVLTSSEGIL